MSEFFKRRIAAGKIKADEIRAIGANMVLQLAITARTG